MILLLADLRQFVIIFLPFSFLNHTNCNLELTKKNTKQEKINKHTFPNRNALANVLFFIIFLRVNFSQIMLNIILIKMSGKKTMFQRQHVSLSKKYNATGLGALYMQKGTRKIARHDDKIRCWLQKWNL